MASAVVIQDMKENSATLVHLNIMSPTETKINSSALLVILLVRGLVLRQVLKVTVILVNYIEMESIYIINIKGYFLLINMNSHRYI